jgi:hypothetical protein
MILSACCVVVCVCVCVCEFEICIQIEATRGLNRIKPHVAPLFGYVAAEKVGQV